MTVYLCVVSILWKYCFLWWCVHCVMHIYIYIYIYVLQSWFTGTRIGNGIFPQLKPCVKSYIYDTYICVCMHACSPDRWFSLFIYCCYIFPQYQKSSSEGYEYKCPLPVHKEYKAVSKVCAYFMEYTSCVTSRDNFMYVPSQWETTLPCNVISHWLGTCTKRSLIKCYWKPLCLMQAEVSLVTPY